MKCRRRSRPFSKADCYPRNDATEQSGEPERRIGSVLTSTVLGRRRVTAVVRPQALTQGRCTMQASRLNRRELLSISVGAFACFATRSLYAEQVQPTGRIAFVRGNFGDGGNRKIFLMNPDGSDLRPLTDNEYRPGEDRPSWSPDSKSIAFTAKERICVCKPDGSSLKILTPADMQAEAPTWSPDAARIAFHAWNQDRSSSQIYTMKSDGTNVRKLTKSEGDRKSGV